MRDLVNMRISNVALLFLVATASLSSAHSQDLPPLFDDSKRGDNVVLVLFIKNIAQDADGGNALTLVATHGGKEVSFQFVLPTVWERLDQDPIPSRGIISYSGTARLVSTGEPTRLFSLALARALREKTRTFEFSEAEVDVFIVNSKPSEMSSKPLLLQLVSGKLPSKNYVSMKCLVDVQERRVEMVWERRGERSAMVRLFTERALPKRAPPKPE